MPIAELPTMLFFPLECSELADAQIATKQLQGERSCLTVFKKNCVVSER